MPLTELSLPSLLSQHFLLLIPTGWVWMTHLFPTGASSDWNPYPSLPLEVIRITMVSLFSQENSCWGLTDLCPLGATNSAPFLPFVPSSAHLSAIGATLEVSAPISGINSVLDFPNLSSCHLLLALLRINRSKQSKSMGWPMELHGIGFFPAPKGHSSALCWRPGRAGWGWMCCPLRCSQPLTTP